MSLKAESAISFTDNQVSKSLVDTNKQLAETKAKIQSYDSLGQSLIEMSKQSSGQCMVPISSVAWFTQGRLQHTNEILVHLGDNYFINRTSHECQGIIGRRQEKLKQAEEQLEKQVKKHQDMTFLASKLAARELIETTDQKDKDQKEVMQDRTRINEEGLLEIEEVYHSSDDEKIKKKKQPVKSSLEFFKDPLASSSSDEAPEQMQKPQITQNQAEVQPKSILKKPTQTIQPVNVVQPSQMEVRASPKSFAPAPMTQFTEQTGIPLSVESPYSMQIIERDPMKKATNQQNIMGQQANSFEDQGEFEKKPSKKLSKFAQARLQNLN